MENFKSKGISVYGLGFTVFAACLVAIFSVFTAPSKAFAIPLLTSQTIIIDVTNPASAKDGSTFTAASGVASSTLPVTVTVTGGCSILNGLVTMTSPITDCVIHYNQAGDATYDVAPEVLVTVTAKLADTQTEPDGSGAAQSSPATPEVVIKDATQPVNITISSGTANSTINVAKFISSGSGILPPISVTSIDAGGTTVSIGSSTTISSTDSNWDGIINAPTITSVNIPETTGETTTLVAAIQVGLINGNLTFDKGVRIVIPGQAGKRIGYVKFGGAFTEITNVCASDNQAAGDALAADSECKIDSGSDMVIWTKHFTSFAAYTTAPIIFTGGRGGGGGAPLAVNTDPIPTPKKVVTLDKNTTDTSVTWKVLGAQSFKFTKTIKKGSKGNEVTELQKLLTFTHYYSGKINGIFDSETKAAVLKLQLANGLMNGFGTVGPKTRAILNQ